MVETKNARIVSTMLGLEDHGILTFWLSLDYGGSGVQGFGGYALDEWDERTRARIGTAYGMEAIRRVLAVVGVEKWEQLPGQSVRVVSDHNKVHRLGHYLNDTWLDLAVLAKDFRAGA